MAWTATAANPMFKPKSKVRIRIVLPRHRTLYRPYPAGNTGSRLLLYSMAKGLLSRIASSGLPPPSWADSLLVTHAPRSVSILPVSQTRAKPLTHVAPVHLARRHPSTFARRFWAPRAVVRPVNNIVPNEKRGINDNAFESRGGADNRIPTTPSNRNSIAESGRYC